MGNALCAFYIYIPEQETSKEKKNKNTEINSTFLVQDMTNFMSLVQNSNRSIIKAFFLAFLILLYHKLLAYLLKFSKFF